MGLHDGFRLLSRKNYDRVNKFIDDAEIKHPKLRKKVYVPVFNNVYHPIYNKNRKINNACYRWVDRNFGSCIREREAKKRAQEWQCPNPPEIDPTGAHLPNYEPAYPAETGGSNMLRDLEAFLGKPVAPFAEPKWESQHIMLPTATDKTAQYPKYGKRTAELAAQKQQVTEEVVEEQLFECIKKSDLEGAKKCAEKLQSLRRQDSGYISEASK